MKTRNKRLSTIIITLYPVLGTLAQVTIGPMDMPQAGDSFSYSVSTDVFGEDPSLTGEDFEWDYSGLNELQSNSDAYLAVSETPVLYQFFFNNGFLYPEHEADFARAELDIDLGLLTLSDTYSYFKNDSEGLRNVGFGASINGLPVSVRNIPVDLIYEFPMSYGDSHTSSSTSSLEIPGIGYYSRELEREVEVEGWGTLTIPGGTYDVLKLRMTINTVDSLYLETTQQGISIPAPELTVFQWLTPQEIQPVLEINQQLGLTTLVKYKDDGISSLPESDDSNILLYPNPTSDVVFIRSDESTIDSYQVFDVNGRLLISEELQGSSNVEIPSVQLAPGLYYLTVVVDGVRSRSSFVKN